MSGADPSPANEVRSGQVKGQRKGQVISNRKRNQLGRYCVVPSWRLLLSSNPHPHPPFPLKWKPLRGAQSYPPSPHLGRQKGNRKSSVASSLWQQRGMRGVTSKMRGWGGVSPLANDNE